MQAFNSNIPQAAQDKILQLVTLGADFIDSLGGDTFGDTAEPEPVEWQSRDGFTSSNDGGYAARQMYAAGNSSGTYRSKAEREFTERIEQDAYAAYLRDSNLESEAELTEEQREEQYEYERNWFDDQYTIAEFEVFVIRNSQEVQCSVLLHYRDSPYHRPARAEEVYVKRWPMVEFLALDNAAVMADIQAAYAGV